MMQQLQRWLAKPAGSGPLLRGMPIWALLLIVAAIVAMIELGTGQRVPAPAPAPIVASSSAPTASPRFDATAVAAMKQQLLAEPQIHDVLFSAEPGSVTWQVGALSDGSSRVGFAGYVCSRLRERKLVDRDTDVRVVDVTHLEHSPGDFRGGSMGHVRCRDGADLGV